MGLNIATIKQVLVHLQQPLCLLNGIELLYLTKYNVLHENCINSLVNGCANMSDMMCCNVQYELLVKTPNTSECVDAPLTRCIFHRKMTLVDGWNRTSSPFPS